MTAGRTRAVAVVVIIASFIALAAFALFARSYEPGRDGVTVPNGALALATPRTATPISASTIVADAVRVVGGSQVPPTAPTAVSPVVPAPPAAPGVQLAACELGLPVPHEQAGLANLVTIVPAFGPYSPEAFAFVPAFEPAFPLVGPLLIAGGSQLDAHADEIDTAIGVLRPLQNAGFDALSPIYEPVRPQVLAGEAQVAEAIKPGVAAFANAPGATCLPAALALLFA